MTNSRSQKKLLFTTLSILSILGYGFFVFAAPPGPGGYNPGETLDPECTPGQLTPNPCIVKSPLVTANNGLTATGSNVQLGGTLLQNTTIDQDGNDFSLIKNPETQLYSGSSTPGMGFSGIGFSHFETDITSFIGLKQDIVPVIGLFANTPDGKLSRVLTMGEPSGIELINQLGNDSSQLNLYGGVTRLLHRNNSTNTFAGINIYSKNGPNATDFSIEFETETGSYVFPRTDGTANQVLTTNGSGQLSWTTPSGGGSGWSLTGNSGTTAGTNFIGTTDAQDFIVKTNGNEIARFGQNGNVAIGAYDQDSNSQYTGAVQATGLGAIAMGGSLDYSSGGRPLIASGLLSVALGNQNTASGQLSTAFGNSTIASGSVSTSFGANTEATGELSTAFGGNTYARSYAETVFGVGSTDYTPLDDAAFNAFDRLFVIGNDVSLIGGHNTYTLWKDGSFAYNDDNFQNDNLGTEQNMFYFNYGNHDGLGGVNTKRAIRLGSATNDEWDINSINVGDGSIVFGFASYPGGTGGSIASGTNSVAFGSGNISSEESSFAFGQSTTASGVYSTSFGGGTIASEYAATAFGNNTIASGATSTAWGDTTRAFGPSETAFGLYNTAYSPTFTMVDRLLNIGNGSVVSESDAFTILKNGQTGIAIDNFEANTNGNIFQIGDGTTGIIAYVDSGTGAWVPVSDERKKQNITDLSYNIDTLMQLRPVSFDYKRNGEHTIGFLAQQVQGIVPEAVFGDDIKGYGMAYDRLVPVTVKAIQEMNLNITQLSDMSRANTWRDALIAWFANTTNGITDLFTKRIHTDELCVGTVCVTQDQFLQMVNNSGTVVSGNSSPTTPDPDIITDTNPDEESAGTDFNAGDNLNTSTDSDNTITE